MKLAIVIPWFGRELKGGAEQQAWQMAWRLGARDHQVDVLTTCCRSHQDDWATNHLAPGKVEEKEGFTVERFPVDSRDRESFDRVAGYLMNLKRSALRPGVAPVSAADSAIFTHELIKSRALLNHLEKKKRAYDWFILLPYLYGPVLDGVRIIGERAALQPCLHDEAYAYLPEIADAFRKAGKLLFNSEGEKELALRLFGPGIWTRSTLVGEGVEFEPIPPRAPRNGFSLPTITEPYILYLGRKEDGKNVPLLLNAFRRFRAVRPNSTLRLLLAGHGDAALNSNDSPAIKDLGVVSEEHKTALLNNCRALFQPSENESFSRVIMEAWMHGKPVAAHGSCLATSVAVQRSTGGWLARSERDWAELFVQVERLPAKELAASGERGRAYARALANWDNVMTRYEEALPAAAMMGRSPPSLGDRREINQFLPNLSPGDAISNHALWIRNELRRTGFSSEIYARYIDPQLADECHVFSKEALLGSSAVIYHHSVGTEITPHLADFGGPKSLIYHNITPPEFFASFRPEFAAIVQRGRDDMRELATHFPISYGVSHFNALDLRDSGFLNPGVLPIPVDPSKWNFAPDEKIMSEMQDGRANLLFVGRIAPNKKQDDLVRAFDHYLDFDPEARLILAGKIEENDAYVTHLQNIILELNVQDSVILTGSIHDQQLAAYYWTANLFWSMSEHEGFCVPLVEAMWFDVPIFAFRGSAVPETLGSGAVMFTSKDDFHTLAAAAHLLVTSPELQQGILQAQHKERERFHPEVVRRVLRKIVATLLA